MGFFDFDTVSVVSKKSHHSHHKKHSTPVFVRKKSRSRSRSREGHRHSHGSVTGVATSIFGGDSHHHKHNSSKSSFFNLGNESRSRSSFFNLGNASRSGFFGFGRPSYYKRSPRQGFLNRAYKQLKRLIRDLVYYAKRHPLKVFMLVLMPLITGGALTALLARFGLRLPPSLERMLGLATRAATGDGIGLVGEAVRMANNFGSGSSVSIERGHGGDMQWERRHVERDGGWGSGLGGGLMGVAKAFL